MCIYVHTHSLFLSYIHSHKCTSQTDAQALSFTSQCFFFLYHAHPMPAPSPKWDFFSIFFFQPHICSTSIWNNLLSSVWHAQTLSSFKSYSRLAFALLLLTLPTVFSLPRVNLCVCVCVCVCVRVCVCTYVTSIWDWGVGMKFDDKSVYIVFWCWLF